ncbi:GGDEF domain-containing protein [Sulfurospirillum sp. 1612]|uniref:GGDEF domain-containing protein n=1 Tax=Sulfurospirillum sp. 1612 TaxID=3094835 RepID=UPI002F939AD8
MNKNANIADKIGKIGKETFQKLENLDIPPYPKYYHETFMDLLLTDDNQDIFDLSKKYKYLFSIDDLDTSLKEACLDITRESIKEFEQSKINIKSISDENIIDIDEIRKEPNGLDAAKILNSLDVFQKQLLNELDNAEQMITTLKLEVEKLERESNIDPLTKIYNRRSLNKDLEEILKIGNDRDLDLQVILFDADDFKTINDTFGHIAGDKTLIFLTRLIQSSIRSGIKVYRFGGEEFIVLLNRSNLENCIKITERIIQNTSESKLLYKGNTIHLTISAGITSHVKGDTIDNILARADKALYAAKLHGKNCCKVN